MKEVWTVERLEFITDDRSDFNYASASPIAAYLDEVAAEQHCRLAAGYLTAYKEAKRGRKTDAFNVWKQYDPNAFKREVDVFYRVTKCPLFLHVDQFLGLD